jgi:ABC-2 type transport system ATP-binding protein
MLGFLPSGEPAPRGICSQLRAPLAKDAPMRNAVETVALNKRFLRVQAVRNVALEVPAGAVYALMGPNGAGKTTLIKILMNLVRASSGRALVLGGDSSGLRGRSFESIGYVSENQKLPDWMTVDAFLAYLRPFYPKWDRAFEQKLVEGFGLPRRQHLRYLSRGMRMKAALASILAYRPRLIVLDEPLSGLDPLVRDDLIASLLELAGETTILISSHDLAEIDSFSTHVGYMDDGRLHISEPIASLRARFRKVEIAADAPLQPPASPPAEWLHFQAGDSTAQWIESAFDEAASPARARQAFGEIRFHAAPMTLREVFLALARSHRNNGGAQ